MAIDVAHVARVNAVLVDEGRGDHGAVVWEGDPPEGGEVRDSVGGGHLGQRSVRYTVCVRYEQEYFYTRRCISGR